MPQWLIKLLEQWYIVRTAPIPFAIVVVIAGIVLWFATTLRFQSSGARQSAAAHRATLLASEGGIANPLTRSAVTFASKMASTENRRRPRRTRPSTFVVSRMPLISHVSTVTVSSPVIWHSSVCEKVAARTSIFLAFLSCASHILHALVCCQRWMHGNAFSLAYPSFLRSCRSTSGNEH